MSLRCACPDDGDETVFGQCPRCCPTEAGVPRSRLDPAITAAIRLFAYPTNATQQDFTLSPPEPRYMDTLDADERSGH